MNVPKQTEFEGGHPLVYYQIYIILVSSIHNTWKTRCFITTGLYLATCFCR